MNKKIWIINHYAGGMLFDCGGRHYNFAKYLKRAGYNPVVFACNAIHGKAETFFPDTSLWQEHMAEEINVPFVYVRGRTYSGNGKQRVLNMTDFYRNVKKTAKEYAKLHGKPDVIYASSVHPLTLVAGIQLAKKFGVKCICEVRDLWPESIVAYSSRLDKKNPVIRLLYQGEKWIYKKADSLVFTMEGAYDYIVDQGWEKEIPRSKVHYINNGVDIPIFEENCQRYTTDDEDLHNTDTFKVVYTGSIRHANNLDMLLNIAKNITTKRTRFLIWGTGDQLPYLIQRVKEEKIENVIFKGFIDKKYVPYIISHADLNIMDMQKKNDIFHYGISPNKLFEYFAAQKPILMYQLWDYNPALEYQAGYVADTLKELCDCIDTLSNGEIWGGRILPDHSHKAAQAFSYENLTNKLIEILEIV